jgi:ribosome-binding protein aMBF1 (putative translation factor)
MDHKNVVGREVGRIRSNRGWSQADLARELQKAGWDISRSEISKIEMRIREVKDWQMMLLVHLLKTPHESFYPRLDPKKNLRDAFAATIAKKRSK